MHEHYEDCPWREQSLYAMDSRNQMLFGYETFQGGNIEYAKGNLRLMSKGLRDDGLLQLCFPSRMDITIPSFSFYFILAVVENYEYAKDESFTKEILKTVEKIMGAFAERVDETGLLSVFPEPSYWNFYEWSEGLDGGEIWRDYTIPQSYDACLNLLYLIVMQRLSELYEKMEICPKEDYKAKADCLKKRIRDYFYDSVRGEFKTCLGGCQTSEKYAQLPQVLGVVSGASGEEKERVLRNLKQDKTLVSLTLSCKIWEYEALMESGEDKLPDVIRDIEEVFGKMALRGGSTFYETEKGAADFGGAGSLCHAWSAVACYIYNKYCKK